MQFNQESRAGCSNPFSINVTTYAGVSLADSGPVRADINYSPVIQQIKVEQAFCIWKHHQQNECYHVALQILYGTQPTAPTCGTCYVASKWWISVPFHLQFAVSLCVVRYTTAGKDQQLLQNKSGQHINYQEMISQLFRIY